MWKPHPPKSTVRSRYLIDGEVDLPLGVLAYCQYRGLVGDGGTV
jgi:hypothetical protein